MKRIILSIIVLIIITIAVTSAGLPVYARNIKESTQYVVINPAGSGFIAGTITNSSGVPIENAYVAAFTLGILPWMGEPAISMVSSDSNGYYKLTIAAGEYNVFAFKLGEGVAIATPVLVETGQTTIVDLSLTGEIIPGAATAPQSAPMNPYSR